MSAEKTTRKTAPIAVATCVVIKFSISRAILFIKSNIEILLEYFSYRLIISYKKAYCNKIFKFGTVRRKPSSLVVHKLRALHYNCIQ